jgi:hypothetical protein
MQLYGFKLEAVNIILPKEALLCFFYRQFDHIAGILRPYASPAFFLDNIIEAELFRQFFLEAL